MQVRRMILRGLSSLPTDLARPHSRGFLYRLSTFWLILFQSTNEPGSTQQTKKNESIQVLRAIAIRKASNAGNSPADRRNTFARLHSLRRQRRRQQGRTRRHPKLVPGGRVGSSRRYDYGRSRLPLHADSLFPRSACGRLGDASYSIYLVSLIVFYIYDRIYPVVARLGPDVNIILSFLLVTVVGLLCYRYVERPMTLFINAKYQGLRTARLSEPTLPYQAAPASRPFTTNSRPPFPDFTTTWSP